MAYSPVKRVVVCVDGTWFDSNGQTNRREGNNSNVYRIWASVKQGTFIHDHRAVKQVAYYETGVGNDREPLDSFNDSINTNSVACHNQINRVFAFCCEQLSEGTDELWLYGFSRGAYILREVADLLYQLSTLGAWDKRDYLNKLQLLTPFRESRQRANSAAKLFPYIVAKAWEKKPVIHFAGLLDTIRVGREPSRSQPALLNSIQTLRHALALNENRGAFQPYLFGPFPALSPDLAHRSAIEAWFIGSHADLGGGSSDDGLALYPLQWILLESRAQGLILDPAWNNHNLTEEPLGLVFPVTPAPDPSQQPQAVQSWKFQYINGIEVEMIDLRTSHRQGNLQAGKKKIKQKRQTRKKKQADDARSNHSHALSHTLSEQGRRPSWKDRFRLGRKSSKATLNSLQSRREPDLDSLWSTDTIEETVEIGPRPHAIQIHSGPALLSLFSGPRQVFDSKKLIGFLGNVSCGSIIHPSVYFLSDIYDRLGLTDALTPYFDGLSQFRLSSFMMHEIKGQVYMDPWRANLADLGDTELKSCRVLVCGRAGVGKSTLINKVFGTVVTQESSKDHGVHNVDESFEMDTLPGLIIHDSRGFQSGATEEIELLQNFVKKRASATQPEDRLDAIWFCIDVPSTRIVHEADRRIFDILDKHARAVPVIIVRTMKDRFINEHYGAARDQLEDAGFTGEELERRARRKAEDKFARVKEEDIHQLEQKLGLEKDFAPFVYTSRRDSESIKELVKQTILLVPDDSARRNFVSAQIVDLEPKVTEAIEEALRLLNYSNWSTMVGSMMIFTSVLSTPTISTFLCARIIKCFGLSDSARVSDIERIAIKYLWKNMGTFITQNLYQLVGVFGLTVGLTIGTLFGGIPVLASLPFASIPPAARMITKCACDLVLILAATFGKKGRFVTKQDFEEASKLYCAKRSDFGAGDGASSSIRSRVHDELDELIPILSIKFYQPLSIATMRREILRIVERHRFTLDDLTLAEKEEIDDLVLTEDAQHLEEWRQQSRQQHHDPNEEQYSVVSGTTQFTDDATVSVSMMSTSKSPEPYFLAPPPPPPQVTGSRPATPRTLHHMKSLEQIHYNFDQRAYNENKAVAELPGLTLKDTWFDNPSELQGSLVRKSWYPRIAELP